MVRLLTTLLFASILIPQVKETVGAEGACYLLVDAGSGEALLEMGADEVRQVASLTKLATAAVAFQWASEDPGRLQEEMEVTAAALQGGANPLGLQVGDRLTLQSAIDAAMTSSDNTSASVLAEHIGARLSPGQTGFEAVNVFVLEMNKFAASLEMKSTRFVNPHGLDQGSEFGESTVRDLVKLSRAALMIPGFLDSISRTGEEVKFQRSGSGQSVKLWNTNELLSKDGVDGGKTGTTRRAGACLMVTALRDVRGDGKPLRVVGVLLNSSDRSAQMETLLEEAFHKLQ
ncbi:MAG: serine hydrolase [Verrucomicrobiota bacterium]